MYSPCFQDHIQGTDGPKYTTEKTLFEEVMECACVSQLEGEKTQIVIHPCSSAAGRCAKSDELYLGFIIPICLPALILGELASCTVDVRCR